MIIKITPTCHSTQTRELTEEEFKNKIKNHAMSSENVGKWISCAWSSDSKPFLESLFWKFFQIGAWNRKIPHQFMFLKSSQMRNRTWIENHCSIHSAYWVVLGFFGSKQIKPQAMKPALHSRTAVEKSRRNETREYPEKSSLMHIWCKADI